MTDMVSLKLDNKESTAEGSAMVADKPAYPYGTSIDLDETALQKLGIKNLPAVGDVQYLEAIVSIRSVSAYDSDSQKDGARRSVCLQITDMRLTGSDDDDAGVSPADKLYS